MVAIALSILLSACANKSPNPGEKTADYAWAANNYASAFKTIKPYANAGKPWAVLRLGLMYENGWGVERDIDKAERLYKKVLSKKGNDNWSKGILVGTPGESGFFNQNSDSIIAEYQLANLYYNYKADRELVQAYLHILNVKTRSKGNPVAFCCEFSGGRWMTQESFNDLERRIESSLSGDERMIIDAMMENYAVSDSSE